MKGDDAVDLARRGALYPGVILHGADDEARRALALELARTLLCERQDPAERPCGSCPHCRRIEWPASGRRSDGEVFHPDFAVLERDLKNSTSVEATKTFLRGAQVSPFESRGQVFVVASAESLSGEAANALLKTLEEPPTSAPRHFLLLAPSRFDLLPTLRSRSMSLYLGGGTEIDSEAVSRVAEAFGRAVTAWEKSHSPLWPLLAASALEGAGDWSDARAEAPWATAARAVLQARSAPGISQETGTALLDLAEALLRAPPMRLRGITAGRILDGLVCHRLTGG